MNNADIAWMLVSTALVLLMTPALAFFYGGLVRSKNALNTMMMSFVALGPVAVVWALLGYSLAFAPGNPAIGSLTFAGLRGVGLEAQGAIPHLLFMCFQGTFAIITPALISGAVVERMRFNTYLAFITLWVLVVYAPVAHWVWGGGFLASMGALDFAGGAVVHVNAASAALVAALVVGPRKDYGRHAILPHNVPFVMLGAGLLWFGWFGFNAGSALSAGTTASLAFANTLSTQKNRNPSLKRILNINRLRFCYAWPFSLIPTREMPWMARITRAWRAVARALTIERRRLTSEACIEPAMNMTPAASASSRTSRAPVRTR